MRSWMKSKNQFTNETWHLYGDFRIVPRKVAMPRVRQINGRAGRRRKQQRRWFIYDGKNPRPVGDQNGYERLTDAKDVANAELDERNRQFHARGEA